MALPVIATPKFELTLPSTGKKYKYRPFLVKEEKVLLIALEGENPKEILTAVKDIVSACVEKINIEDLTIFDLEYLFLKLREKSISDIITMNVKHESQTNIKGEYCENVQEVKVNLKDINVVFNEKNEKKIQLTDSVGLVLKYPNVDLMEEFTDSEGENEVGFAILEKCIDYIYDKETVYPASEYTSEDLNKFIESLSHSHMEKIEEFFSTLPKLEHKVTWKCSKCGEEETIVLNGLGDFFI